MNIVPLKQVGRWAAIALIGLTVLSCKKDNPEPEPDPEPTDRTEGQLIKDDIYKYYKLYSLWADEYIVPDYSSKPWEFTDKYNSAQNVLIALRKMTPVHNMVGYEYGVFDRFSFIQGIGGYDPGAAAKGEVKMDRYDGYGFEMPFDIYPSTSNDKTVEPIIGFIEGGSPAYQAGFRRSDIIAAINEDTKFSVDINDKAARSDMMNRVTAALNLGSFKLKVKRQDGTFLTKDISYSNYIIDPIYSDTIYKYPNNNIGYLALTSFEQIDEKDDGEGSKYNKDKVDAIFNKFQNQQIKDLIVDLRYNGGGYVDAAVYIADKIGGKKTVNQLMVTYETNKYLRSDAAAKLREDLKIYDTKFKGLSGLELNRIYFLVSEETASAAEMLINVLKPYFKVQLIASGERTFGKPVGFFRQTIQNKIYFWPASFMLRNKDGVSEYWDGMSVDKADIKDYVFEDLGSPNETMIKTALQDAVPGSLTQARVRREAVGHVNKVFDQSKKYSRPERGMFKKIKD